MGGKEFSRFAQLLVEVDSHRIGPAILCDLAGLVIVRKAPIDDFVQVAEVALDWNKMFPRFDELIVPKLPIAVANQQAAAQA